MWVLGAQLHHGGTEGLLEEPPLPAAANIFLLPARLTIGPLLGASSSLRLRARPSGNMMLKEPAVRPGGSREFAMQWPTPTEIRLKSYVAVGPGGIAVGPGCLVADNSTRNATADRHTDRAGCPMAVLPGAGSRNVPRSAGYSLYPSSRSVTPAIEVISDACSAASPGAAHAARAGDKMLATRAVAAAHAGCNICGGRSPCNGRSTCSGNTPCCARSACGVGSAPGGSSKGSLEDVDYRDRP